MTSQLFWNVLIAGSLYAMIALGFGLTYNIGKFFNMSHGASFLAGGYAGYFVLHRFDTCVPGAILVGGMSAMLFTFVTDTLIVQRLVRREASRLTLFIATLGLLIVVESFVGIVWGNEILVLRSGVSETISVPGGRITVVQAGMLATAMIALLLSSIFFFRTAIGRRIRAVSDDRELAGAVGVPVDRIISIVTCFSGLLAGIAGVLFGLDRNISPTSGMLILLWGMVAAIVGGTGSFTGPILGAFLLAGLEHVSVTLLDSEWRNTAVFFAVIGFLAIRPGGILGK